MEKIITKEERKQLLEHGIFLEGYFNAINSLGTVTWSQVIIVLGVGVLLIYIGCYIQIAGWLIGALAIFLLVYPIVYVVCFRSFFKKKKRQLLEEERIEINWATIVQIDDENLRISFIEDEALSPKGKPYIVDYVATENDCRCVVKGERIILVHVRDKNDKEIVLPMIPKKEFQMIREKEECGPINIFGVEHVPHVNAFRLKENEVIFHSRLSEDNMTIDLRKYGWKSRSGNRLPTAIFVYERNGEEYDLKMFCMQLERHIKRNFHF